MQILQILHADAGHLLPRAQPFSDWMPWALSSQLSCLPAPGHVLREALTCLGGPGSARTQASETPPPWGDGPIPGQFLSPDRITEERQEVPHRHPDAASHPSGWGLEKGWGGPEVTHGEASQSQEPDPGVPTALFPGSFTADRSVSPPVTPKEMDGGKGRKGRKKSRPVFKRPVLKKSICLYRLPAPPRLAGWHLVPPPSPFSTASEAAAATFQSQLEGGWLKSQMWKTVRRFSKHST